MRAALSPYLDTAPKSDFKQRAKTASRPSPLLRVFSAPSSPVTTCTAIIRERFGLTWDELLGRDRHQRISAARKVAAWLLRSAGLSYPEIGTVMGRDHTTVMNAVASVERDMAADTQVWLELDAMAERMAAGASNGPMASSASKEGSDQP